ncbi:DUF4157 domain-containing protein [uncultured Draconibacterium sp.]|uniref:eCIS core domain-containing protein n=1 Tax=uncultured Draconibacterium sp. TaxID=1573823 RepID=UPI002AA801A5|nr:DUF4157 domain-containing protein [uncultured Draconibacterium sp.]
MKAKVNKPESAGNSSSTLFSKSTESGFFPRQAKLNIGQPDDKYEREADRVADQVINRQSESPAFFAPSQPGTAQPKLIPESILPLVQKQEEEEEEAQPKLEIQRQSEEEEEELIQTKSVKKNGQSQNTAEQSIAASKGGGSMLDSAVQTEMESGFGADFGGVKIHTDSTAVQMNKELGARAFTSGNDIYFNNGQFQPGSESGKKLLAHELTHTIQQGASSNKMSIQKWPFSLTTEQQKALFRSRNYGPITYTTASSAGSGFEARYNPTASRLDITVRAKVRFADTLQGTAGSLSSPNIFMNESSFLTRLNSLPSEVVSRIMPYFQWTDSEKEIHMIRFRDNLRVVKEMWEGTGMTFQVNETGWEDVTASPRVNLVVGEGDAVRDRTQGSVLGISFDYTNPSGSDHLQIELVKQVSASDAAEIVNIIQAHDASLGVSAGDVRSTRSYMFNDPGSRRSAPEGLNNIMSLESDSLGDTNTRNYDTSVYFGHNESEMVDEEVTRLEEFFSDPMILLENEGRAVDITLSGYASAPGSTAYNHDLVERRMIDVEGVISNIAARSDRSANITESFYPMNDSDMSAEEDLAANPDTHDPSCYRRVDVEVEREGTETQNVLAHELGHVFGLGDEYAEVSAPDASGHRRYNRPTGSQASHHGLAQRAGVSGGALVADDNRMMSGGNEVGAAHYSTFADALRRLTSKPWKIIT